MSSDRAPESAPGFAAKVIAYGILAATAAFVGLIGWAVVRVVSYLTSVR